MTTLSDQLAYFQKHPQSAYSQGFTAKLYHEALADDVYDVYKFYLPTQIAKKVRFLRKYFKYLDDQVDDPTYKRRKHWCEFAEEAMFVLSRVSHLTEKDYCFPAGSRYVCALPWAIFGPLETQRMARNYFETIEDVGRHYHNSLHGKCYPVDLHFRKAPELAHKIAKKFKNPPMSSPNYWMAVGIALTYDIIHNCGPDCHEFFDLFTNDYRDSPDHISPSAFQELRLKILGVPGSPDFSRMKMPKIPGGSCTYGPTVPVQLKPKRAIVEVTQISDSQDLEAGETTRMLYLPKQDVPPPPEGQFTMEDFGVPTDDDTMPIPNLWPEDLGFGCGSMRGRPYYHRGGLAGRIGPHRYNVLPP